MGLLVSALATITTMICDNKEEKNDYISEKVKEPAIKTEDSKKEYTEDDVKRIILEMYSTELESLKKIYVIEKSPEDSLKNYIANVYVKEKDAEESSINQFLENVQNNIMSDKISVRLINKFVKDSFVVEPKASKYTDALSYDRGTLENFEFTVSTVKDFYIDRIAKKLSENNAESISRSSIINAITELLDQDKTKTEDVAAEILKELPKTHGKHSEIEYNLIKFMEVYKENIPLYNKFVDAYTKFCGFNRKGTTNIEGKTFKNTEIAFKLYDELKSSKDVEGMVLVLDRYLIQRNENEQEVSAGQTEVTVQQQKTVVKNKKIVKKKLAEVDPRELFPFNLKNERCVDIGLSRELELNERLERAVDIFIKSLDISTKELLNNGVYIPDIKRNPSQKSFLVKEIQREINSRKKSPYQNLNKISNETLYTLLSTGIFDPSRYCIHSALRFLDRFVLEDFSDEDLSRIQEITSEKVNVFERALDKCMTGSFKLYSHYDKGFYSIHVPVIPLDFDEKLAKDYKKCFGNTSILMTIDATGNIHTLFKGKDL